MWLQAKPNLVTLRLNTRAAFMGLESRGGGSCKNDPAGLSKNRMEKHLCLSSFETLPH